MTSSCLIGIIVAPRSITSASTSESRSSHAVASSEEDRAVTLAALNQGIEESGIARRPLVRNSLLGAVGLNQRNRRYNFAGLGYWMRDSARGRSVTARVGRLVVRFGFERVGLDRIEILAAVDNHASRRTAERIGARFEGVQRNRLRLRDRAIGAATYSLIPSDFEKA